MASVDLQDNGGIPGTGGLARWLTDDMAEACGPAASVFTSSGLDQAEASLCVHHVKDH